MRPARLQNSSRSSRLLPPIMFTANRPSYLDRRLSPGHSRDQSTKLPSRGHSWSRYHKDCLSSKSMYLDWSNMEEKEKPSRKDKERKECAHGKSRSVPVTPPRNDGGEQVAVDFLERNKDFLEAYVLESVPLAHIEKWLFKKLSKSNLQWQSGQQTPTWAGLSVDSAAAGYLSGGQQSPSWACLSADSTTTGMQDSPADVSEEKEILKPCRKEMFMELLKSLQDDPNEVDVLWELALCITRAVRVDAFRVYKVFSDHPTVAEVFVSENSTTAKVASERRFPSLLEQADYENLSLLLEVAERGASRRVSRADHPDRFPDTPRILFPAVKIEHVKEANHILYQPILTSTGKTAYVIEMWRINEQFSAGDEEISSNFLVWGSLALHYCNMYMDKKKERSMSDFLLEFVRAIFEEMISLDQLIKRILEFAQRLVNADRASLFLVDYRNFELVSTVFDLKFEPGQNRDVEKKEIRMPINRGIAGHVASSGETMNIPDAYSDCRFNREVDEATGYKTISILCMPIKVQGKVIGVVQMINKRDDDSFHHEDEMSFEIFSTFFGLALHHARLYDRIMRKEQKYKVALEVLSYHNTCKEGEVHTIINDKEKINVNLDDFYLDPYEFNDSQKCKAVITMFDKLFDISKFNIITLARFILTVKKNYRTVPYHNFDHGWSVAHSMYVILKNDVRKRFNYKMRLALFVSCLCHDLDHRGYTNKYTSETASPLAAMYSTSTLEHHHFNITVTILQQDGHNIFSHMSCEEYKEILGFIRQCILATDLAAFFPNLAKMEELYNDNPLHSKFNWANSSHRDLAMAISMTAADLSAASKPWAIQIKTVKVIFEEFYDQGDREREAGRNPIPMMDRNKPEEQPASQVGFLSQICVPCYHMLYRILPKTRPMYRMVLKNLYNWSAKADLNLGKKEHKEDMEDIDKEFNNSLKEELFKEDSIVAIIEESEESGSNDSEDEGAASVVQDIKIDEKDKTEITETLFAIQDSPESWEDEEVATESRDKVGGSLWLNIEGVSWIDEEGLIMRPNRALNGNSRDKEDITQ